MKRILSALIVLIIGIVGARDIAGFSASSQTIRYYTCKEYYDRDGVKHSTNKATYITFANGNSVVYASDSQGNSNSNALRDNVYKYVGTKDGKLIYRPDNYGMYGVEYQLIFNSDFSRLNFRDHFAWISDDTEVWVLSNPQDKVQAPQVFY